MNSKKVFYGMVGVLALIVIAAVAGTVYGTGQLEKTGDTLLERKLEDAALNIDEESLTKAKRDVEQYKDLEQVARSIVPQEKDQARTVRELIAVADQSGIQIETIGFPSSELGVSESKKTGASNITQLTPVEGLSGVYAMPIDSQVNSTSPVPYATMIGFLERLENNRRTSHVTNLSITPSEENRDLVTFSLQINAYIKP
jgi:hypothetical protein